MSAVMMSIEEFEFDALLQSVLEERNADAPAGLEQRLTARLAQEAEAMHSRPAAEEPFRFVQSIRTQRSASSTWVAIGVHGLALVLILAVASRHMQLAAPTRTSLTTVLEPAMPPIPPKAQTIGGGGGQHDVAPVTQGHLPKFAPEQIVPPKAPPTEAPKLAIEPTVVMQKDLKMADNTMPNLGTPNSSMKGFSLGNGTGTGIGSGDGSGMGPGSGGNTGGGVYRVGGGVSQPMVLVSADPEFSEEARKAKFSGNVLVYFIVDENGTPTHIRVARGVGMGLDEKAVEAVRLYKFKPGMKDGKPVKVEMAIEVNFQIM
jgi:periplasmic protein TonB